MIDYASVILRRADRIGESDFFCFSSKDRMINRGVSDIAVVIDKIFHPLLQGGVRERGLAVLLEKRREHLPFLLATEVLCRIAFNDFHRCSKRSRMVAGP